MVEGSVGADCKNYQQAYVLEINTAPGLEGSTLDAYAEAFQERGWYNQE